MKGRNLLLIFVGAIIIFFLIDIIMNYAMMRGVNNYYGLNQQSKVLIIGHSHLMLATDKERMEHELGVPVSKYCREGVNVTDRLIMVRHFLNSGYADSLKVVLYGVDLATFTGSGLSKNSYKLFYPFIDDPFVGEYIKSQTTEFDYWTHKLVRSSRFNDDGLKNSVWRGWSDNWDNLKNAVINIPNYKKQLANGNERHIKMNDTLIAQFKETINILTKRGVKVVLVNTPTLDLLNQFEPEKYASIVKWYRKFADQDSLVEYWDFNPTYSGNHTIFADRLHLNARGQQLITTELIERLHLIKEL